MTSLGLLQSPGHDAVLADVEDALSFGKKSLAIGTNQAVAGGGGRE